MDFEVVGEITDIETIAVTRIQNPPAVEKAIWKRPLKEAKGHGERATA
jgi:hypothetical protein